MKHFVRAETRDYAEYQADLAFRANTYALTPDDAPKGKGDVWECLTIPMYRPEHRSNCMSVVKIARPDGLSHWPHVGEKP